MEKIDIGKNGFIYPMPVALLGTKIGDKANFMTLGWVMRASVNPPLLTVSVNKNHLTNTAIRENKTFSINFPNIDLLEKTDYCGLVSGKRTDKSNLFKIITPHGTAFKKISSSWCSNKMFLSNLISFKLLIMFPITSPEFFK